MTIRYVFGCFWLLAAFIFLTGNSTMMFEGAMAFASTVKLQLVLGSVAIATPWVLAALPFQVGLTFKKTWFFGIKRPTFGTLVVFAAYGIFIAYNILNGSNALTTSRVTVVAEKQSAFDDKTRDEEKRKSLKREQEALGLYRPEATVAALISAEKQSKRWTSSQGCTDATSKLSREFCAALAVLEAELATSRRAADLQTKIDDVDAKLSKNSGATKEVDVQAAALARWTGRSQEDIWAGIGAFGPLCLEFGALTFLVFAGWCFGWDHSLIRQIDAKAPNLPVQPETPPKLLPDREGLARASTAGVALSTDAIFQRAQLCEWFFKNKCRPVAGGSLPEEQWFSYYTDVCKASKDTPLPLETFRRIALRFVPQMVPIEDRFYYHGVMPLVGNEEAA